MPGGRARTWVVALLVYGALLTVGCGDSEEAPSAVTAIPSADAQYPVTISNCGRTLTFDKAPSKVIAAYEPVLKVFLDLGLADRVSGQTKFNEPEPPLPAGYAAAKKRIPVVSKDLSLPAKETMLSLGSDLVVVVQSGEFDAKAGRATRGQLAKVGAASYVMSGWCTPENVGTATLQDTYDDILNLGRIFGISDRAEALVKRQQDEVAAATSKVAGQPTVRVIGYNEGVGPVSLLGGGIINEVIEAAGGENAFATKPGFFDGSVESVGKADPAAFVVFDYPAFDGKSGRTADEKAKTLFRLFSTTQAAKAKRWVKLYAVDQHPGGFNAEAVERLARQLHPDAFETG